MRSAGSYSFADQLALTSAAAQHSVHTTGGIRTAKKLYNTAQQSVHRKGGIRTDKKSYCAQANSVKPPSSRPAHLPVTQTVRQPGDYRKLERAKVNIKANLERTFPVTSGTRHFEPALSARSSGPVPIVGFRRNAAFPLERVL